MGRAVSALLRAIDDPYTRLVSELSDLRSQGIRDLGDAHLHDPDSPQARARVADALRAPEHPLPLLASIRHHLIAGSLTSEAMAWLFGDSIVPLSSASWKTNVPNAAIAPERIKVLPGLNHLMLAHHDEVYAQLKSWLEVPP
jgi:hypothetical protein